MPPTSPRRRSVALVTGAAQGIGSAITNALAATGHTVAAIDRNPRPLTEPTNRPPLGNIRPFAVDVTDAESVNTTVKEIEHTLGPIEALVNVAGVLHLASTLDTSDNDWHTTFAVNSTGVFLVSRAVATQMRTRRHGAIVTVSSNAAGIPRMNMAAYAASKAAATMFTKCLGLELAAYGIRCNVVAPGSTDTPMQRRFRDTGPQDGALRGDPAVFRTGIPLGRIATPDDVANAVLFLLSDQARHITMHDLYVDGGATLRA